MTNKYMFTLLLLLSTGLSFDCDIKADSNTFCLAPERLAGKRGTYVTYEVSHVSGRQVVCIGRGWTYYPIKSWCDWDWWIIGEIGANTKASFVWDDMTDYPGVECVSVGEPGAITWNFSVGESDVTCMGNSSRDGKELGVSSNRISKVSLLMQ